MRQVIKPNLATADEVLMARMVIAGTLQLSEIPSMRRANIERKVSDLIEEEKKKADMTEEQLSRLTKAKLCEIAKQYPAITDAPKLRKTELIEQLIEQILQA